MKRDLRQILITALLISIGVILPLFTHLIAAGNVLLPMHLPILIGGFVLKRKYAILVGFLTPIISNVLTGMPMTVPMLPIMIFELTTYALVANTLYQAFHKNIYFSLVVSMIAGRFIALLVVLVLTKVFQVTMLAPIAYIVAAISTGFIGILIQLLIIVPTVVVLKKTKFFKEA